MSLSERAPGLYPDVSEAEYHHKELGIASKHGLDELARAPAAYWEWLHGPEPEDTKPFALGRAAHMAILEPEKFRSTYLIAPDFGPCRKTDDCSSEKAKENKLRKQAWYAEHAGATILESADARTTFGMVEAIASDTLAAALFEGAQTEVTALWSDAATGVRCKGRFDLYRPDLATLVDVKTAADARESAWRRVAFGCTYYRQEAMYRAALETLGMPVEHFVFLVVEKDPPYLLDLYELDASDLRLGREEVRDCLDLYAHCLSTNTWPRYPSSIKTLKLRPWMKE